VSVLLDDPQKRLLIELVEASRKLPPDQREDFVAIQVMSSDPRWPVKHPGLPPDYMAHPQDLTVLRNAGLLSVSYPQRSMWAFFVLPLGQRYYEQLQRQLGSAVARIEHEMRALLDGERFQQRYTSAHKKWVGAEQLLWAADSSDHISKIGLGCREAMQDFAAALVEIYRPTGVDLDPDAAHTKNRLRSVVATKAASLGEKEQALFDAMVNYWDALDGVVQRLVHANTKQGQALTIEDARRVVFIVLSVMSEIDRALDQPHP